ncbi:MAG TPA: hypothetical protein VM282_10930 [Acidimicrobiales bacterium]|nr:hypothetical protein [Acidimicrobiales bacterium]
MVDMTATTHSTRLARYWTHWYTAGLPPAVAMQRRAEIDSDHAEHTHARQLDGWSPGRIAREQRWRLVRGVTADLGWRRDVLRPAFRSNPATRTAVVAVTSMASLLLAAFHVAFAAYLLGATWLAERSLLGGLDAYADEVGRPIASTIAAVIIGSLGAVLLISAFTRNVSPLLSNATTVCVAGCSVLFFWLGMAPVGLVAIAGSTLDAALRAPAFAPSR